MHIVCLNQDPGISPSRAKGAAVHLREMRRAFQTSGADVRELDEPDRQRARERLEDLWRSRPIDLVYERYSLHSGLGAEFAASHGIPLVLELNTPLIEEEERHRSGSVPDSVRARQREVFAGAACIVAVSNQVAEYARERGADPGRVHVFANGVDLERFRPRSRDDALRASLVPDGRFALLFHGRLRPWHGFDRLVRAMAGALQRGADLHLVVVGQGDFEAELSGRIDPGRWVNVGWVDHEEIARYVAVGDALVLSYPPDAPFYFSPLKLAEAMACGLVPIVPRLGDLDQVVAHEESGWVYPPDRPEELVAAIVALASHPALWRRLSRGAQSRAQGLSWNRIASFVLAQAKNGLPT